MKSLQRTWSSRRFLPAVFCAVTLAFPAGAFAACVNDADAAQRAASFATNPSTLLEGSNGPRSTDEIAADVQVFVASYPEALPAVLGLLKDLTSKGASTAAIQKAIGTGLGKAANVCKTTDLTFSLEIQGELGAAGSPDANAQYAALTGNDPTRSVALSSGVTGSGGGSGGQTTPFGGTGNFSTPLQTFFANSVSNKPTNYFTSSTTAGSAPPQGATPVITVVCTVSRSC